MYKRNYGPMDDWFITLLKDSCISYLFNVETLGVRDYAKSEERRYNLGLYGAFSGKYNVKNDTAVAVIAHRVFYAPANLLIPKLKLFTDMKLDPDMPVYLSKDVFPYGTPEGSKWAILLQISNNTDKLYQETLPKKDSE